MTQPTNRDLSNSLSDIESKVRSLRAYIDDLTIRSAYEVAGADQVVSLDSSTETTITNISTGLGALTQFTITPVSANSLGVEYAALGEVWASGVALNTNQRCYVPFSLSETKTVLNAFLLNGSGTIAGNIDVSIYDEDLAKLVSTGSIAHSTASAVQILAIADTSLAAGRYYMSLAVSDGTTTIVRTDSADGRHRAIGAFFEGSAFTAPATATPAALNNHIPLFGLTFSSAFV